MFFSKRLAVLFIVACLFMPNAIFAVDKAKFEKGGLEYHFVLNDTTDINESFMPLLPTQLIEKFAPMFIFEAKGKSGNGMYIDTPDRKFQQKNLILRVKKGSITLKARANDPKDILDLPVCEREKSKKDYEIDYFGIADYSISSMLKIKDEELNLAYNVITPAKVGALLEKECPSLFPYVKDILKDPNVVIPGITNQYSFEGKLGKGYQLSDNKDIEVDLSIWFFPPTRESIIEFSFTGPAEEREKLEALQKQTANFFKEKRMLSTKQIAKTETFFDVFMPKK